MQRKRGVRGLSTAASCSAVGLRDPPPRTYAASERSRAASARQAAMAALRTGLRAGAGHSKAMATGSAAADDPPAHEPIRDLTSRRGIATGRMNASSSEVVAPASTELTAPANSTAKPTTAIAIAASPVERDASVPTQTNTAPTAASAAAHAGARPSAREVHQQELRERAEGGERRQRRVADHLVAEREQRRHHERSASRPPKSGEAAVARAEPAQERHGDARGTSLLSPPGGCAHERAARASARRASSDSRAGRACR